MTLDELVDDHVDPGDAPGRANGGSWYDGPDDAPMARLLMLARLGDHDRDRDARGDACGTEFIDGSAIDIPA